MGPIPQALEAPFPWFGGKRKVAHLVWPRFGAVQNYVEPFFGSGAMLLNRQTVEGLETVNDVDGFVVNAWRAIRDQPDETAHHADHPVFENDLHARHSWLVGQRETLRARLEGDPAFCDPQVAGWWLWGMACWIGGGFCDGNGPWAVNNDGRFVRLGNAGQGVNRKRVHLGDAGQGVNRKRVHLGDAGQGVNRRLVHLGDAGQGVNPLLPWFQALSARLRYVRVCSGDWTRVCGPSVTHTQGLTAVFLDPPYADTSGRAGDLYAVDSQSVAHEVRRWAIAQGDHPLMRIALCGYEGEHDMPASWDCIGWNAGTGYAGQSATGPSDNGRRERIWFSPHCLLARQASLW